MRRLPARFLIALLCLVLGATALSAATAQAVTGQGTVRAIRMAPWSVQVKGYRYGVGCSGEVIGRHEVLTARHCPSPNGHYTLTFASGRRVVGTTVAMTGAGYWNDFRLVLTYADLSRYTPSPLPMAPTQAVLDALNGHLVDFVGWGGRWAPYRTSDSHFELGCGQQLRGLCYQYWGQMQVVEGDSGGAWLAWYHSTRLLLGTEWDDDTTGRIPFELGPSVVYARDWIQQQSHGEVLRATAGTVDVDSHGGRWLEEADGFRHPVNDATTAACLTARNAPVRHPADFDLSEVPPLYDVPATCTA